MARLEAREKWKLGFEGWINGRRRYHLRSEVIVRDVNRMDDYPETEETKKGISPWFKANLVGTYHNGISLQLNFSDLIECECGWRLKTDQDPIDSGVAVALIGNIPYENIVHVDWEGNEYYSNAPIFCLFDAKNGEPYEKLAYCERVKHGQADRYVELVQFESVIK